MSINRDITELKSLFEAIEKKSRVNEKKPLKAIAKKLSKSGKINTIDDFVKAAKKHGYSSKDVGKHLTKSAEKHANEYDPSEDENWTSCPECGAETDKNEGCGVCGWNPEE